jgi:hypothetical protein
MVCTRMMRVISSLDALLFISILIFLIVMDADMEMMNFANLSDSALISGERISGLISTNSGTNFSERKWVSSMACSLRISIYR